MNIDELHQRKEFLRIEPTLPKVNSEEIAAWETKRSLVLPGDYRELILSQNGGRVTTLCGFPYPTECGGLNHGMLVDLYGIGRKERPFSIDWAIDCIPPIQAFPSDLIPVVQDQSSRLVCLRFEGPRFVDVTLWADNTAYGEPPSVESQRHYLCDTMDEFWELIEEYSDW